MSDQLFTSMQEQFVALDEQALLKTIDEALSRGVIPADIISKGLSTGLEIVGEKFEKGEFFLPELILSGDLMKKAIEKIRPHMVSGDRISSGKVLLGTVEGDIHDLGKNIFSTVLKGDGYEVYDLGVDVPPSVFLDKAREIKPDVIGMSALISLAVSKMAETIFLLRDHGVQSKVVVGGAALTKENAKTIGADEYGFDAWQGLRIVRRQTNR
ncbi:MAG: cobalamin-dependent protein [Deltaproteobacteria bacterium]|nr:cobalamin-dependent protein [Deltaproteobacteria bacterium]